MKAHLLAAVGVALSTVCVAPSGGTELGRAAAPSFKSGTLGARSIDAPAPLPEVSQGRWVRVFDTRHFHDTEHAVNDHTIVRDSQGQWHLFGIFQQQSRWLEGQDVFVHGVSGAPAGPPPPS